MESTAAQPVSHTPPLRQAGPWIVATLLLLLGVALFIAGVRLVFLGGSPYYVLAGVALAGCGARVAGRRADALWIFGGLLGATTLWSVWEVGFNFWALMPRTICLCVLALPLLCIRYLPKRGSRARLFLLVAVVVALLVTLAPLVPRDALPQSAMPARTVLAVGDGDWSAYGNRHSDRYSPLAEITSANVGGLKAAWTYHAGLHSPDGKRRASLELTPLMVDNVLYGCTAFDVVFALDPVSGRELWRRETLEGPMAGGHPVCRGVSFYRAPADAKECPARLLIATVDNHLVALDAKTGLPCAGFGEHGRVDLSRGLGHFPTGWTHPTSPPAIVNGTAVVGAYVVDNQSTLVPPGVVRGYDALTGVLRWAFDPERPDVHTAPAEGESYAPSTPNAWTAFSGDEALNLVFVATGNGSPDFYGVSRTKNTDRFSTSLVALDASSGEVRWSFQAVHHDLWDYDLAAQPALVDFPVDGGTVPALVVATKTGQLFVLDRRTGGSLTRLEERAVPKSSFAEEPASPTQPYSVELPDLSGAKLTEADMWGITPFDQLYCRIAFRESVYQGMYTPPGLQPTIRYPGELGGIDWGSVSVDEGRGLLIVNANYMADRDQLIPREQADREGLVPKTDPRGHFAPGGAMQGTPYGVHWGPFLTALGVPCQRPPYGTLTAVDLRTRQVVWSRPLGDARNSGPFKLPTGLPIELGSPNIGGTLATAGDLVFVAATQDEMFRAFDVRSGRVLWQVRLPAAGHATPMTYRAADGHQYVLIAAGGGSLQDRPGDSLMAFRLAQDRL